MAESEHAENITSGSVLLGSEAVFEFVCQPCGYEGNNVEAGGYCIDCCEYLCDMCYRYHSKVAITRHHKLADKETMPKPADGVKVKDICTERCLSHEDEIVKYFCPTHEDIGCTVCVTVKHKTCDVKYIADICKDLENTNDYKTFQTRMQDLILKYENAVESSTRTLEELQALSRDFDTLIVQKRYCQMFTDMKHAEKKLLEFKDVQDGLRNCVTEFNVYDEGELQSIKGNQGASWTVVERPVNGIDLTHVTDIYVKLHNDNHTCLITGIAVMSKENFMIVDNQNNKIKLCDAINKNVRSDLETEVEPWGVTKVSENLAAVTLPDAQKVIFLKCDKRLVIESEIKVNGECNDVDSAHEKLFVSYTNPCKVEILNMSGELLQSFVTNGLGEELFKDPKYVFVNTNNESIYVSDYEKDSVIQFDMKGTVKREYVDDELVGPTQMTVGAFGLIYLCGEYSSNLYLLTPECIKAAILLKKGDGGIKNPRCVDYCDATDRLFIGMSNQDSVKVYQARHLGVYTMIRSHKNGD